LNNLEVEKSKFVENSEDVMKLEGRKNDLLKEKLTWENKCCIYNFKEEIFDIKNFPLCLTTYATWNKREYQVPEEFQKVSGNKTDAWKVDEPLGFGTKGKDPEKHCLGNLYGSYSLTANIDPSILVFDDGGNNFRDDERAWSKLLTEISANENEKKEENIRQVILKTAYPLAHGRLFQKLTSEFNDKLTIITSIDEIRKEDVLISKGVSWEQTTLDLIYELKNNKSINKLLKCKHLIINLQSEGALYLEMKGEEIWKCRLIFDPEHLEGEWVKARKIKGGVIGSMTCFTAAISYGFIEDVFNIENTITRALSAMRKYKITGHGCDNFNPGFPFESICNEIIKFNSQFASAFVPIPEKKNSEANIPDKEKNPDICSCDELITSNNFQTQNWTILEGNYKPETGKKPEPLFDTSFRFALLGKKELSNTPFLKINKFLTYDRREIEALRNIKNLVDDYLENDKGKKPLSLAVFGTPGSGKSFAVEQLAESLSLPFLEFNLSQFADINELVGAFHQVRDKVLAGNTPIVFWDEFDSQAYLWLQYLLAPMQDGKFQEGQLIHPIGKCIFIFAGGTSYTFKTFGIDEPQNPNSNDELAIKKFESDQRRYLDFILKKGPDFKSRLSGYLNVQGPNQLECLDEDGKVKKDNNGEIIYNTDDIIYPVRRALFIRGISGKKDDEPLVIDYGLLSAMIKTQKYLHGSRSLEKLLNYLKTKNNHKLQRSNLPSFSVLSMLVHEDFIGLLDEDKTYEFHSFSIAPSIHQKWINIGDTEGWKLEYHKDYNYLPAVMKDENIAAARRIQKVLDVLKPGINLEIVRKSDAEFYDKVDFQAILNTDDYLERFAIEEHRGWVDIKEKSGWKFDKTRNDDRKLHNCILEWTYGKPSLLPIKEQNKDKLAVQNFLEVLNTAGFVIIKK
jgi:hypothetical protein